MRNDLVFSVFKVEIKCVGVLVTFRFSSF